MTNAELSAAIIGVLRPGGEFSASAIGHKLNIGRSRWGDFRVTLRQLEDSGAIVAQVHRREDGREWKVWRMAEGRPS